MLLPPQRISPAAALAAIGVVALLVTGAVFFGGAATDFPKTGSAASGKS